MFRVQLLKDASEEQINSAVEIFCICMKNDIATICLAGGDVALVAPMIRSLLRAGREFGEFYVATDEKENIIGFALYAPPGQAAYSTEEQRAMGFNDFWAQVSDVGKEYYKTHLNGEWKEYVNETLQSPTAIRDTYWLSMLMVHPSHRRQGVARALIQPVREIVAMTGARFTLHTADARNVVKYQGLGFELLKERTFWSPWGDWPAYIFVLPRHRA
ncbi:hypothetical protein CERSUDRAFT_116760 [Gelatoporia subvermispora B]|uniref:N-acetyltransferase domain-containing protein n=1 Tax=Ceriporiopsis subvermispora (strain B) TaxID=914234 RepID=M2QQY3_CERS8|nr:hypothetical protein CERSUDRAFT_116760 [Gelatoporia subvermispora B]